MRNFKAVRLPDRLFVFMAATGTPQKFPTIGQYIEVMGNPQGVFRTLGEVRPLTDMFREPVFSAGNYSVVFQVRLPDDKFYALKCYTRLPLYAGAVWDALGRGREPYLPACRFLSREVYLWDAEGAGAYYPVLLREWIEGESLGGYLARLCRAGDRAALAELAARFDRLGLWLLRSDFAHGDLKADNLLVTPEGELRLIDCDAAYVPALSGLPASSAGSPAYQHPARRSGLFDARIDDYPVALISFSLHALSRDPSLLRYSDGETIFLDASEVQRGCSEPYASVMERWAAEGEPALYALGKALRTSVPALDDLPDLLRGLSSDRSAGLPDGLTVIDDEDPRCAVVALGGLFGFADLVGRRMSIAPVYGDARPFREGLAAVRLEGRCMMIDRAGRCVVDCGRYRCAESFRDGRALVCRNGLYGFIDRRGEEAIAPRYESATGFREGLAVVRMNGKYGYIDTEGREVVEPVFDYAGRFSGGRAEVEKDGVRFFLEKTVFVNTPFRLKIIIFGLC